tara:strand:- start:1509 stop:1745 length:237 start_codon:yes stop_codon:yes gene_type:complete
LKALLTSFLSIGGYTMESDNLEDIKRTYFGNDDLIFEQWLDRPVKALEHKTPRELLATVDGCREVKLYLSQVKYGDYS